MSDIESGSTTASTNVAEDEGIVAEDADDNSRCIDSSTDETVSKSKPERKLERSVSTRALPGIVLHVFRILSEGSVEPCDDPHGTLPEALEAISSENNKIDHSFWVDIDADERDRPELNEWIESLKLGSFVTDLLVMPAKEWVSHVVSTRSKALIMIRILPLMHEDGTFISSNVEYLAVLKCKHLLLTYTTTQSGGRKSLNKKARAYMTQEECLQDGSSSAALIAWLEFHIFRTRSAIERIRKDSAVLVKIMDTEPTSIPLEEILKIRDRLLMVLAVAEEQATCLAMIQKMDKGTDGVDFKKLKGSLSLLISTADATERMGLRLEKRVTSLKQAFDSHQQDRMNRRLAILTVVSAIFMPLTFMAGIYGMNFSNMPELEYENSYYILLTSMVIIAASMVLFFYYDGWFE